MPKSRTRAAVRARRQPRDHRGAPGSTTAPARTFALALSMADELLDVDCGLDAELMVSALLGASWQSMAGTGLDPDRVFTAGLIDYAARRPTPASLAMLTALEALSAEPLAGQARAAAADLARRGVPRPGWADRLGVWTCPQCWGFADVYGDQQVLCALFTGPLGEPTHVLNVLIEHHLAGAATDAWIGTPDVLAAYRDQAATDPLATFTPIEPARAGAVLAAAFTTTDLFDPAPAEDTFTQCRALALARIRSALPAPTTRPGEPAAGPDSHAPGVRAALLAEFARADGATLDEPARRAVDLIVDYGRDQLGDPLRWSPIGVERFLLHWLPAHTILDDADLAAVPAALGAWVCYAGRRRGLPEAAVTATLAAVTEDGALLPDAYHDEDAGGPAKLILDQLLADGVDITDQAALDTWIAAYGTRFARTAG